MTSDDGARSAGARTPELLFEAAREELQFSEDGSVENAEAVVAEMKQRFPEQFGNVAAIDRRRSGPRWSARLTKEALAKMKPYEIARLDWAAVRTRWLAE